MPKTDEITTSAAVAQGAPAVFSRKARRDRRIKLAAEMVFMGLSGQAISEIVKFDRLAFVWDSVRQHIGDWESRITEQVSKKYPGFGAFRWTREIRDRGDRLVIDFASTKSEQCLTAPMLRAELEFKPSAGIVEAEFFMIDGHGKSILEHEAQLDQNVLECGPNLPMTAGVPTPETLPMNQVTNPNVPHDPSMRQDVSTGRAMQIINGKTVRSVIGT